MARALPLRTHGMAMALTRLRASTTDAYRGPDIGIGRCGMSGRSQMEFLTDVRHTRRVCAAAARSGTTTCKESRIWRNHRRRVSLPMSSFMQLTALPWCALLYAGCTMQSPPAAEAALRVAAARMSFGDRTSAEMRVVQIADSTRYVILSGGTPQVSPTRGGSKANPGSSD